MTTLAADNPTRLKRVRKLKTVTPTPAPVAAKPAAPKAAKPTVKQYTFASGHTGPSDGVNENVSRVAIDFARFGTLKDAPMTDRDRKNLDAFRNEFGNKQFERGNLDTGIIKRLGERGMLVHVKGSPVDPKATFKLSKAA